MLAVRWSLRFGRPCRYRIGDRWQVDETYVRVAGRWRYVYRAIDQFGQVIDMLVCPRRDAAAARRFFDGPLVRPRDAYRGRHDRAATYPIVVQELAPGTPTPCRW